MPTIARLGDVTLRLNPADHAPPHVHAFHGEDEALVDIRNGDVVAGHIRSRTLAVVREYVAEHREELLRRWRELGGAP